MDDFDPFGGGGGGGDGEEDVEKDLRKRTNRRLILGCKTSVVFVGCKTSVVFVGCNMSVVFVGCKTSVVFCRVQNVCRLFALENSPHHTNLFELFRSLQLQVVYNHRS